MKQNTQNSMKRVNVKSDLMQVFVMINKGWIMINAGVNGKNWLIKVCVYDKESTSDPSNCKCECDKSSDVGEYLDYENCECRKNLVDKLVEECTENVDEVKIAGITLAGHENVCVCSCTIYFVLIAVIFTISIGISVYFVYSQWYSKKRCYSC